ncbi:GNAT family N-acetyltransferase [Vibrio sp. YIC-376]|uniref:GNAT family N-acetyltransferase n=1 Tax=Vibrio sp. YIC-376 TaxID=3136162 RepID=UPI00402A6738
MKPDLYGERVFLRTIRVDDAEDLFEIYGHVQTMQFASDPTFTSLAMIHQMMESVTRLETLNESLEWAIVEQTSNKVIGTCGLHTFSHCRSCCEIGCLLNARYWNQGYMSEALGLLFSHAKSQGIYQLVADIDEDNFRSRALFEKLGFELKGALFHYSL